jgi:hypothetical protein
MDGLLACMGEMRNAYIFLFEMLDGSDSME